MNKIAAWSRQATRWIWCFVIVGLLASIPAAYQRAATEQSSREVQYVMHYRDLLVMSETQLHPASFIQEQLTQMKQSGIQTIAVHESSLYELHASRRIDMYSSREASMLTSQDISSQENHTYILFSDNQSQAQTKSFIEQNAQRLHIATRPWMHDGQEGIILELPLKDAAIIPLDHDPFVLQKLQEQDYGIVAYVSNRRLFDAAALDQSFTRLTEYGVNSLVIDGDSVPGVTNDGELENITVMAELMQKHNLSLALLELQKTEPEGLQALAGKLDNQIIRTHLFSDFDASKLMDQPNDKKLDALKERFTDRLVLAAKDRNIRMILLHAKPAVSPDTGRYENPLPHIYSIIAGENGVTHRLDNFGIQAGQAPLFEQRELPGQLIFKWIAIGVSVSIIALMIALFYPTLLLPSLLLGMIASVGLYVLSEVWLYKILALGASIAAPTVALIMAIRTLREKQQQNLSLSSSKRVCTALVLFIRTSFISLIGGLMVVSLLNDIKFLLKIDQFNGVGIASMVPIALVALYILFFDNRQQTLQQKIQFVKRILLAPITILWVVIGGASLAFLAYYFIRTGNSNAVSPIELLFRALLEQTFGVRPRLKEFLFAYPLFFLGAYLTLNKTNWGVYVFAISIIGQISLVNTFAHLHTPLVISLVRVSLGLVLGCIIGLLFILAWRILTRIWNHSSIQRVKDSLTNPASF